MQLTIFDVSNTLDTTGLVIRDAYKKPFQILSSLNQELLKTNHLVENINAFTWLNRPLRTAKIYSGDELFRQIFTRALLFGKVSTDFKVLASLPTEEAKSKVLDLYGQKDLDSVEEAVEEFNSSKSANKPKLKQGAIEAIQEAKKRGDVTVVSMEEPDIVKGYIENHKLPVDFSRSVFGRVVGTTDKSVLFSKIVEDTNYFGGKTYERINFVDDMLEELAKSVFLDSKFPVKRVYTPLEYDVVLRLEEKALKAGIQFTEEDKQKLKSGINASGLSQKVAELANQLKEDIKKQVHGATYKLSDLPQILDGKDVFNI